MVCVDNYQVTRALFESANVIEKLPGRKVIQLSTGTPKEARESETWFVLHGA
jgi:3-hydroxyisobutyrate dehydrogenase-like beta-hydroxyacid dehydrogenase